MKRKLLIIGVALMLPTSYLVTSCMSSKSDVAPTSNLVGAHMSAKASYRQDTLGGLRVRIPVHIPKSVFYPTIVAPNNSSSRVASSTITLDELAEMAKPIVDQYPDLSLKPLKTEHLNQILHDFPDFKDEKSVRENSDIVLQYYNGLVKYELKPLTEKKSSSKANGRNGVFGLNPLELEHLSNNAVMISRYAYASNRSEDEAKFRYGSSVDGYPSNAFKHSVWTCLIIREAMLASYSKNNAIYFTRNITSDHECDMNGNRRYDESTAMDLHNNLSARSWYNAHFGGGVWPFPNVPSETQIYDFWQESATYRGFAICNAAVYIPSQYSGGWGFLYGEAVSLMHNRLYYVFPRPDGC